MVTIVTDLEVRQGAERQWDTIMRQRMTAAKTHQGWVGGQLLRSEEKPNKRVIVGTWNTRADWERWHQDPRFAETRRQLDELVSGPEEHWWHHVILDVRKAGGTTVSATSKGERKRAPKKKTRRTGR
ncbi:MAG TPA: antibiotic biosynthesis monooxygenase [Methylomirabilota bacterium]|nr:antibiotic biosynthesis monooxygenase [Methylomirabilota bacterium]